MAHLAAGVPEAPEGWSGPFHGYYLSKQAPGPGEKWYDDFSEAVAAAEQLEGCVGITTAPSNPNKFWLKAGLHRLTQQDLVRRANLCSWVKGDVEMSQLVWGEGELYEEKRRLLKEKYEAKKEARILAQQQEDALFAEQMAELDAEAQDFAVAERQASAIKAEYARMEKQFEQVAAKLRQSGNRT